MLGVCRSSEERVQRYRFSRYPPNISHVFLKKKCSFSVLRTKRGGNTLLYYREPALSPHRGEGKQEGTRDRRKGKTAIMASLQSSNIQNPAQRKTENPALRKTESQHYEAKAQHYESPRTTTTRRKANTTKDREPALRGGSTAQRNQGQRN